MNKRGNIAAVGLKIACIIPGHHASRRRDGVSLSPSGRSASLGGFPSGLRVYGLASVYLLFLFSRKFAIFGLATGGGRVHRIGWEILQDKLETEFEFVLGSRMDSREISDRVVFDIRGSPFNDSNKPGNDNRLLVDAKSAILLFQDIGLLDL